MRTIEETIEYLRNAYIKLQRYENRSDARYASGEDQLAIQFILGHTDNDHCWILDCKNWDYVFDKTNCSKCNEIKECVSENHKMFDEIETKHFTTCDKCKKEFEFFEIHMIKKTSDDEEWYIVGCPYCSHENVFGD